MKIEFKTGTFYMGDCFEVMAEIAPGSVDMVLNDPPYGTVKGLDLDGWENGNVDWDDAFEPLAVYEACNRILRPNGVSVLFSQEPYTARLTTEAIFSLPFLYRMAWVKDHFANALSAKKAPVSYYEDILVFAKRHTKHDFEGSHPLRPYAQQVKDFIGLPKKQIFARMGNQSLCHFLRCDTSQFTLCTGKAYTRAVEVFKLNDMPGLLDYEALAVADRIYRGNLIAEMSLQYPKIFNLPPGAKYRSNLLSFKKDYGGGLHPTQKPVALFEDLIRTYTNQGNTVLDFTAGSGTTAIASIYSGRRWICIERDEDYFAKAIARVWDAEAAL